MAQLDRWMEDLAREMDLEVMFPKNSDGGYSIPLEDGLSVSVSETPGGVSLFCTVCPCPAVRNEEFFREAMLANLFGQGTKGAVLALTDDYTKLTLSQELDAGQYREFHDVLEDFLNSIDFWTEEVKELIRQAS